MTGWECSPETLLRYSWDKTLRKAELRLHLLPGNGSLPAGFLQGRANVLQILLVFQLLEALQILNRHHGRDGLSAAAQHDSFTTADALQKTVSRDKNLPDLAVECADADGSPGRAVSVFLLFRRPGRAPPRAYRAGGEP